MKITTTGSSNLRIKDVGNPYLHKRNKVGITSVDNSKQGRAMVYDQHIIDQLYLSKDLNEQQHNACDKYLGMIHSSGAFATSFMGSLDKIFTGQYSSATPRSVILVKVQRTIRKEVGLDGEKIFWKIMVDSPKKVSEEETLLVKACSDTLLNYWYVSLDSPVSLFQQAIANPV